LSARAALFDHDRAGAVDWCRVWHVELPPGNSRTPEDAGRPSTGDVRGTSARRDVTAPPSSEFREVGLAPFEERAERLGSFRRRQTRSEMGQFFGHRFLDLPGLSAL